ncbi:MAG: hypothetical protein ACXAHE_04915 [Roseburia sp. 1XD42-69]|jgi:hypothetical protein
MRRKLFDNTLTCISALCVFQIIRDIGNNVISDDVSPFINIIITLGEIIIFLMIIFNFYYKKRMFVDLFDMLKTMTQNNKLHPLREVVMVVNDRYEDSKNRYKICNAEFQYTLIRKDNEKEYDVNYKISLRLKKKNQKNSILKFYIILDIEGNFKKDEVPINVTFTAKNGSKISFTTHPQSVTISKIDYNKKFSGLYEINIKIPEIIIKGFKKNYFQCDICYTLENNFSFSIENNYNFFIYPDNYGKRIAQCNVNVLVSEDENYNIECYCLCAGNIIEKAFDFIPNKNCNNKDILYKIFSGSFKPLKNSAYFINLRKL